MYQRKYVTLMVGSRLTIQHLAQFSVANRDVVHWSFSEVTLKTVNYTTNPNFTMQQDKESRAKSSQLIPQKTGLN